MSRPEVNVVAWNGTAHCSVGKPNEVVCGKTFDVKDPANRYYGCTRRNFLAPFKRIGLNLDRDRYAVCKDCQRGLLDVATEDINI